MAKIDPFSEPVLVNCRTCGVPMKVAKPPGPGGFDMWHIDTPCWCGVKHDHEPEKLVLAARRKLAAAA